MNVACDLGDDAWRQLGVEALRQGTAHTHTHACIRYITVHAHLHMHTCTESSRSPHIYTLMLNAVHSLTLYMMTCQANILILDGRSIYAQCLNTLYPLPLLLLLSLLPPYESESISESLLLLSSLLSPPLYRLY